MRYFGPVHVLLYRWLDGRFVDHLAQGRMPLLLLTTTGRRSGRERTHPIGFVADGSSWLVMGSNGALPREPSWISNIRSRPNVSVQLGARRFAASARVLDGAEREQAWDLVRSRYRFFEAYQAALTRQIPIVRLRADRVSSR